jgi:hypothetical protein
LVEVDLHSVRDYARLAAATGATAAAAAVATKAVGTAAEVGSRGGQQRWAAEATRVAGATPRQAQQLSVAGCFAQAAAVAEATAEATAAAAAEAAAAAPFAVVLEGQEEGKARHESVGVYMGA